MLLLNTNRKSYVWSVAAQSDLCLRELERLDGARLLMLRSYISEKSRSAPCGVQLHYQS